MHVIATVGGRPVEIQVRTVLQHAWANTTEALADQWGRGIRYGEPPTGANEAQIAERAVALGHWRAASDAIAWMERELEAVSPTEAERIAALVDESTTPSKRPLGQALAALRESLLGAGAEISRSLQAELNELGSTQVAPS